MEMMIPFIILSVLFVLLYQSWVADSVKQDDEIKELRTEFEEAILRGQAASAEFDRRIQAQEHTHYEHAKYTSDSIIRLTKTSSELCKHKNVTVENRSSKVFAFSTIVKCDCCSANWIEGNDDFDKMHKKALKQALAKANKKETK